MSVCLYRRISLYKVAFYRSGEIKEGYLHVQTLLINLCAIKDSINIYFKILKSANNKEDF